MSSHSNDHPGDYRVLVVDDTLLYRLLASQAVDGIEGFKVVGQAENGQIGLDKVAELKPDIVLTDIEMPVMDGLGLLDGLRARHKDVKAIVISSVSVKGGAITLDALQKGAFDYITKPEGGNAEASKKQLADELRAKLGALTATMGGGDSKPSASSASSANLMYGSSTGSSTDNSASSSSARSSDELNTRISDALRALSSRPVDAISIGISTGGPKALDSVFAALPATCPPIFIVQHMPGPFLTALAEKLDSISKLTVVEASNGILAQANHAYVAPGGKQMGLKGAAGGAIIELRGHGPENHCLPSASYLLRETAGAYGRRAMGIVMTGMGDDGADGLLAMRKLGAMTIAQNQATCTVFGMPKQALAMDAAEYALGLDEITRLIGSARA